MRVGSRDSSKKEKDSRGMVWQDRGGGMGGGGGGVAKWGRGRQKKKTKQVVSNIHRLNKTNNVGFWEKKKRKKRGKRYETCIGVKNRQS